VEPYDWAALLRSRLDDTGKRAPLDGLKRGGYKLVYTDTPSELQKNTEAQRGRLDLRHSIGLVIDEKDRKGTLNEVTWNGVAFHAGLTEGMQILAINGIAYDGDVLTDAIRAAKGGSTPLELIVKNGDRYLVAHVDYHGGLRYPHLERDTTVPARLDDIFTAK